MERRTVNPTTWSLALGFTQGELVADATRTLYVSGQTAMDTSGVPQHPDDVAAQAALAMDNLEAVLAEAGMTLAHLVRLAVYATDIDGLMPHYGVIAGRLAAAGATPTSTMLEVSRLAVPGQLIEVEGVAVA
ncbi:RidA family protein [Microbacterium gorillae]|uniref:RidA family protein n=1 Tax=Microbacterium gorillae TaxID=1231063 RepID=UPI00058DBA54|nr:RidA family protein [Microbacterium gorillae]